MASLKFKNVYIDDYFTLVGPKERDGKLKNFNMSIDDYYYKMPTFEQAEIKMQRTVIENLINGNNECDRFFDYLIGGDLINQISITSSCAKEFKIPFIGVYSACATFVESMIIASSLVESENANNIICVTSSHNLTAERQYRFPVEYGNTRPNTATSTATASVGAIISSKKNKLKIKSATIGKVVDLGVNDVNHMGAVMAPACADTIYEHLKNTRKTLDNYDLILTGDLGHVGLDILKEYYENVYNEKLNNVLDAGSEIYYANQGMFAGGSGPCCLPLTFFCKVLKAKKYKKILLVATGSLHTPVLVNQHQTIPSIAHAIEVQVLS